MAKSQFDGSSEGQLPGICGATADLDRWKAPARWFGYGARTWVGGARRANGESVPVLQVSDSAAVVHTHGAARQAHANGKHMLAARTQQQPAGTSCCGQ